MHQETRPGDGAAIQLTNAYDELQQRVLFSSRNQILNPSSVSGDGLFGLHRSAFALVRLTPLPRWRYSGISRGPVPCR